MSVTQVIENKLTKGITIAHLAVINESHQHAGHAHGGEETHFQVQVVSADFVNVGKVARHQKIYQLLAEELSGPVHALAVKAYTPDEWQKISHSSAQQSPLDH